MGTFLTTIGEVITALMTQIGNVFGLLTSTVALQILFGIFMLGAGIGLVRRIMGAF